MILDLTLSRVKQVRDIIVRRQAEEFDRDLAVREVMLKHIVGAVHGAAGNEQAGQVVESIQLRGDRPGKGRAEQVAGLRDGDVAPDWLPSFENFSQTVSGSVR